MQVWKLKAGFSNISFTITVMLLGQEKINCNTKTNGKVSSTCFSTEWQGWVKDKYKKENLIFQTQYS